MVLGKLGIYMQKIKLDPYFIPLTKNNLKWIKSLNERTESVKLLEEHIGKKIPDTGLGNNFLDKVSKAQATKPEISKLDCIKLKSFYTANNQ